MPSDQFRNVYALQHNLYMEPSLVTKYHEFTHTSEVDTSDVMFEVHEVYDGDKATKHLIPTA